MRLDHRGDIQAEDLDNEMLQAAVNNILTMYGVSGDDLEYSDIPIIDAINQDIINSASDLFNDFLHSIATAVNTDSELNPPQWTVGDILKQKTVEDIKDRFWGSDKVEAI